MAEILTLTLYVGSLSIILIYCMLELHLALRYIRFKKTPPKTLRKIADDLPPEQYPIVTVQLPVFNEMYVVERLIDAITAFDYPQNRLQIQVLDDSTDETVKISAAKVAEYQAKGFDIELIHRKDRKGYKAGALQEALPQVKGDLIAIFDADFIPNPDFLHLTIPYFDNLQIGVVQTRWQHINEHYSLLTKVQAFFIDVHFTIEQTARNSSGYFMNFNGTAGVWRKKTIVDAGGWQADTLTEDLDLSYRAQLKGWKFQYLEQVGSPSELPADMRAFKSQQFRWIKGGAETAAKILPSVSKTALPFSIKVNAFQHLLSSSIYIVIFLTTIISVPMLLLKNQALDVDYLQYGAVFFLSNIAVAFVYFTATRYREDRKKTFGEALKEFVYIMPAFLAITIGLSLHNALAAIRGWAGEKTPFVRTPKFNLRTGGDNWHNKEYTSTEIDFLTITEGGVALYFLCAIIYSFYVLDLTFMPIYLLAFAGFSTTFFYSVKHAKVVEG